MTAAGPPRPDGLRPALRWGVGAEGAPLSPPTASGMELVPITFDGRPYRVYANANLSVYSAQRCNARCPFCVEELRPLSRGRTLAAQRRVEADDERYLAALRRALEAARPVDPSVSITGGEPSKDPRLPAILDVLAAHGARKRTMTTNASGLEDRLDGGGDVLERVLSGGLAHLNISRAHPDERVNQRLMRIAPFHPNAALARVVARSREAGPRVRLSCVLLRGHVDRLSRCLDYLAWAASLGVDNVVFRQLMRYDAATHLDNVVTRFSDRRRAALHPILEAIRPGDGAPGHPAFRFLRQVVGYYYYVEVYEYAGPSGPMAVCFEGADLARVEADRRRPHHADVVHELVFHPDGRLCSTWQPWDGVLLEPQGGALG